jgi:GTPase
MSFKSGYIAIVGLPNSGKSTLLNRLLERSLAIVSNKPQTTRNQILGIRHLQDAQLLFLDTPGWYEGKLKLDACFRDEIKSALVDADLILFLLDGRKPKLRDTRTYFEIVRNSSKAEIFLLVTKIDALKQTNLISLLTDLPEKFSEATEIVPISSKDDTNLKTLQELVLSRLPEGPAYYPEDSLTDRPHTFLFCEFLRESYIDLLDEELPYSMAVACEELEESEKSLKVSLTIFVERPTQKAILIGESGIMLSEVKRRTCIRARKFFTKKVLLDVWIKVKRNWRRDSTVLQKLGYRPK